MTVTETHDNPAFEGDTEAGYPQERTKSQSQTTERTATRRILKDVCCVSLGFFLLFTSYQSMSNLQSSINKTYGTISQSIVYAALILSSAFIPTWMIKKLGESATMAVCMLGYSLYTAAQFYPTAYTLIPSAVVLGLAAAPLWSAKCTYLTLAAQQYAKLSGEVTEVIVSKFFGMFFMFFQSSQVVGNLISSTVLLGDSEPVRSGDPALASCGAAFCQASGGNQSVIRNISDSQRYTMAGIYLGFTLASSAFIVAFVNPLSRHSDDALARSSTGRSALQQLGATFGHLRHPYQLLIIPLTFWSGLEQAFLSADFTVAYVSCGLGVHMVGYTMICFGVCNALCSLCWSAAVKRMGRVPVFFFAFFLHGCLLVVLFYWAPSPDQLYVFFLIPALWGVADAVWQTQINALYGVLFPRDSEAAFSNYRLWESSGFIVAYICSSLICITAKLSMLVASLVIGLLGYALIEIWERKKLKV